MKRESQRYDTSMGVILVTAMATLLVACATQEEDRFEVVDTNSDGQFDSVDVDGDGAADIHLGDGLCEYPAADRDGNGRSDGLDLNCDGSVDMAWCERPLIDDDTDGDPDGLDLDCDGAADIELGTAARLAPSGPQAPVELSVAPSAPDGAAWRSAGAGEEAESLLAASPTISPSNSAPGADFEHSYPPDTYACASGTLCTGVWDPNSGQWKVFKLYYCRTYAVSNWLGSGFYWNNQTGTPRSVFYDRNMNEIFSFYPGGGQLHYPNWGPVWYVKNC
jgi:hypothetical protein